MKKPTEAQLADAHRFSDYMNRRNENERAVREKRALFDYWKARGRGDIERPVAPRA